MRIQAFAIILLTASAIAPAQAQPAYYARSVAGLASTGDGGPATEARVFRPASIVSDAAGNVYVAEGFGRIRKIAPNGAISSLVSRQEGVASGDNGPASEAGISSLFGLTVSGNFLYIAQRTPCNIRRVNLTTGIISNFAGTGTCAAGPDGPAASTSLNFPGALAADLQGRIYVTESATVRRVDPSTGRIELLAGDGTIGFAGDTGPAFMARLNHPLGLAVDAQNNVYISDTGNCRIRRVAGAGGLITTVAGSATCGNSGDGGLAIQAQLSNNSDLSLDSTGSQLYIASNATTIRRLQIDTGIIDRFAGTGLAGPVQDNVSSFQANLIMVSGIRVNPDNSVLLSDFGGNRVAKIVNGNLTTLAGALTYAGDGDPAQYAFLSTPIDVILEPGNRLLIGESINGRIRRLSPPGILSTMAGSGLPGPSAGNGASALQATFEPGALFRDQSGNVYLTDNLSNTVRRIGTNGAISQIGPVFNSTLGGIAVDADELYAYVALTSQHRIARISLSTNTVSIFAGLGDLADAPSAGFSGDGGPANQARLNAPLRIAIDGDGNFYVADSGNHRIRRISANGDSIQTVAGNGLSDFSGDGNLAAQASLPAPTGVAVDTFGNLIVSNNSAVFRIEKSTGRMTRIAGSTARGTGPLGVPALQARFNLINNVSIDERGVIYFADQINLRVVALTPSSLSTPMISSVIAPGSFGAGTKLASAGWMEIYGEKLATTTLQWTGADFAGTNAPTSLGGVRVRIGGKDAFIQLVSPGQINAVLPADLPLGNITIEVLVTRGPGNTVTSEPVTMTLAAKAPYLLAPPAFSRGGKQHVVGVLPDGTFVGPPGLVSGANFRPARPGNRVVIYGIGFGPVTPEIPAGTVTISANALPPTRVRIGGQEAIVEFAGLANGYVGLYQFNVVVPSAPGGEVKFEIIVDGQPTSQALYFTIE